MAGLTIEDGKSLDSVEVALETGVRLVGRVTGPDGAQYKFEIEPSRKERMLEGLDDIAITERYKDAMAAYESKLEAEMPWLAAKEFQSLVQKSS